jgi:hypothetical protein
MEIHGLVAFGVGILFQETTTIALDLNAAPGFGLDMFDVRALLTNNIGAQIKARNRLKVDRDLLLRPLATTSRVKIWRWALFALRASEATLVDQVGQVLLHEFFYLLNSLFETLLGLTRDVKVERWFLS